jgi:hypothetical protein
MIHKLCFWSWKCNDVRIEKNLKFTIYTCNLRCSKHIDFREDFDLYWLLQLFWWLSLLFYSMHTYRCLFNCGRRAVVSKRIIYILDCHDCKARQKYYTWILTYNGNNSVVNDWALNRGKHLQVWKRTGRGHSAPPPPRSMSSSQQ